MAGKVRVSLLRVAGVTVQDLVVDHCPVTRCYGEVCQRYDPHTGELRWCPLMYGLVVRLSGHQAGECRTPEDAAHWMATDELEDTRSYEVRCLAATTPADIGATRPR